MPYGSEYRFERRIKKLLEEAGYLVIKCGRSKPFDLIAIKNQKAVPIEIKAKKTPYSKEQKKMQTNLAKKVKCDFVVIRQAKKRGKIHVETYSHKKDCFINVCDLLPPLERLTL